jgi:adenosylmethionine-8-amino-7-oxononanoate aminotransferase
LNQDEVARLEQYDRDHIIHPNYHRADHEGAIVYASGRGAILTDIRGNDYIDALSSLWNVAVGHGRAELGEAAAVQMSTLGVSNAYTGYANVPSIKLTEKLLSVAYSNMSGVFYANSGSEANDFAIKAARYYWFIQGKPEKLKIISRTEAYHGGTMAATAVTGMAPFHKGFGPEPPGFVQVSTCYPYRCEACGATGTCSAACADVIEQAILRVGSDTVAAVIAEPVHGAGGVIPPCEGYWPRLREICDRYGVLLIADEVITGFGRTGKWFALDHWGVQPDMMTFAKAVTSAYIPLSGFLMSQQIHGAIMDGPADAKFMLGCTNSAHATACAVALRNIQILEAEGLVARAEEMGRKLQTGLGSLIEMPHVGNVRGLGMMAAVEIVEDKATKRPYPANTGVGPKLVKALRERGVVTRAKGESMLFAPPLVITDDQLDQIVNAAADAIDSVTRGTNAP